MAAKLKHEQQVIKTFITDVLFTDKTTKTVKDAKRGSCYHLYSEILELALISGAITEEEFEYYKHN